MRERVIDERQIESIIALLRARTGIAFGPSRRQEAESRIRRAMADAGISDPAQFVALLHGDERTFQTLVEHFTVAETYFFREREQFEALRHRVLPELLRQRRHDETLRLWSAGCASGEEAYSLAMLLDREGLGERAAILGTDISGGALSRAHIATYSAWSFRDNSPQIGEQYFRRSGDRLVLIDRVRRMVRFDYFNLASEEYPIRIAGPFGLDVILCRNVLIYFDPDTIARVARQMFASLRDGGWLITGPSDPPLWSHAPYETVLTPAGVLYRRGAARTDCAQRPVEQKPPARHVGAGAPGRVPATAPRSRKLTRDEPARALSASADNGARTGPLVAVAHQSTGASLANAPATHPMSPELHYLHAMVQMDGGRYDDAISSLRRALYLDRSMVVAHFALGSVLARRGAIDAASRSYRNVLAVCGKHRADEVVPFSDGECVGRLVEATRARLDAIRGRCA